MTQFEMTDVVRSRRQGDRLDLPLEEADVLHTGLCGARAEREHLVGHVQSVGEAGGPTRLADSITSIPPPEPRSSTVSPSVRDSRPPSGCRSRARRASPPSGSSPRAARRRTAPHRTLRRSTVAGNVSATAPSSATPASDRPPRQSPPRRSDRRTCSRSSSALVAISSTLLSGRRRPPACRRRRASTRSRPTCRAARARAAPRRSASSGGGSPSAATGRARLERAGADRLAARRERVHDTHPRRVRERLEEFRRRLGSSSSNTGAASGAQQTIGNSGAAISFEHSSYRRLSDVLTDVDLSSGCG